MSTVVSGGRLLVYKFLCFFSQKSITFDRVNFLKMFVNNYSI